MSALAGIRSVTASLEDPTVIGSLADHLLETHGGRGLVFAQSVVILLGDIPITWTAFGQCMTLLFIFTIHAFHPGLAKGFYENDDEPPGLTQKGQDLKHITSSTQSAN